MLPQVGKLDSDSFDRLIFPYLGRPDKSVLLGPRHGVDAAVVALDDAPAGSRRVMVVAEDPTFGLPVLLPYLGWSIVHICASDVAVLGVNPRYLTICLLLPPGTDEKVLDQIWRQVHEECRNLDIAIVGGHTGVYPGIAYPLNGGCTVWGFGNESELTPPSAARPGDRLVITKGPAVEATAILALQTETTLTNALGAEVVNEAKRMVFEMTVVPDALICRSFCHAMHDATEGGLLGGIYEMANAANIGVRVFERSIVVSEPVARVCGYFDIDPLIAISEGTLVAAVPAERLEPLKQAMAAANIPLYDIGEFTDGPRVFVRKNGSEQPLEPVKVDPFWAAYFKALT